MSDQPFDPATTLLVALAELRGADPNSWTEGTLADRAIRLDRVVAMHAHLAEVQTWLELSLAESMEEDDVPAPGVGVLHRKEYHRTSWRHAHSGDQMREDLATAVATDVALDRASGEVDAMKRNVALHAIRTAYEAIPAFSSLKVAGAKRLGLRTSDYRSDSTYYRVTVEVAE